MTFAKERKLLSHIPRELFPLFIVITFLFIVSVAANVFFIGKTLMYQQKYITYAHSTAAFHELLKEHFVLLASTIKAVDTPEAAGSLQALENNTTALSVWMGERYGEKTRYEFQSLWRLNTEALLAYTRAAKKQDNEEKSKQLQKMSGFSIGLTDLLIKTDSKIQKDALKSLLDLYSSRAKTIIDTSIAGDFVTLYKQQHDALVIMNSVAEVIAGEK
jgi:hypothetical protein